MGFRQFDTKPLSRLMVPALLWMDYEEKYDENYSKYIFREKNVFENIVCKILNFVQASMLTLNVERSNYYVMRT